MGCLQSPGPECLELGGGGMTWGQPSMGSHAESFLKKGNFSVSPGSILCIQHSVKGSILPVGRGHRAPWQCRKIVGAQAPLIGKEVCIGQLDEIG